MKESSIDFIYEVVLQNMISSDEPYVGVQILKERTNRTCQLNFV